MNKHILIFIFVLSSFTCLFGQQEEIDEDSKKYFHFTAGVDVAETFINPFLNKGQQGMSYSFDAEFIKDFLISAEYGTNNFRINKSNYEYISSGRFIKTGIDVNVMRTTGNFNQVLLGFRVARSNFEHELKRLNVIDYWGDRDISLEKTENIATWFELKAGLRMEIFSNFYLGWSIRARFPEKLKKETFDPLYFPGYNKNSKQTGFGFTYSLFYKFSWHGKGAKK